MGRSKAFLLDLAQLSLPAIFIYVGFQSASLDLKREAGGAVIGTVSRGLFAGFNYYRTTIEGVQGARMASRNIYAGPRTSTSNAVVIYSGSKSVPVFRYSDSVPYTTLQEIEKQVNAFMGDKSRGAYSQIYHANNAAGGFGLFFLVLWLLIKLRIMR